MPTGKTLVYIDVEGLPERGMLLPDRAQDSNRRIKTLLYSFWADNDARRTGDVVIPFCAPSKVSRVLPYLPLRKLRIAFPERDESNATVATLKVLSAIIETSIPVNVLSLMDTRVDDQNGGVATT